MPCLVEPSCERFPKREGNGLVWRFLLEGGNCEVVDWRVLLCLACNLDLVPPFVEADINSSLFNVEDPEG